MSEDIKNIVDQIGNEFHELKKRNDEIQEQVAKGNEVGIEAKTALEAVNENISKLEERQNQVELAVKRQAAEEASSEEATSELHSKAIADYIRTGDTKSFEELQEKSHVTFIDPDGGYIVSPDMNGRIVQQIFETSPLRQLANVVTLSKNSLEGLYDLDEVNANWVGEVEARPETATSKLGKWVIEAHELYAKPLASQTMLDDADLNVEAYMAAKVADKFARMENAAFINGDGVKKPRGIMTYADGTSLPGQVERVISDSVNVLNEDDFLCLEGELKAGYRANGAYLMNRSTAKAARLLKDGEGRYFWQPSFVAGQPASINGYSVFMMEDMADVATGNLAVAFGDFREAYTIVDRMGIRTLRDPYSSKPFVEFYTTKRVGGDVLNFEAYKVLEIQ